MSRWTEADDELMWLVAESPDDTAVEDLISRRPELRSETLRRASLVAGLKGARPEFGDLQRVPAFSTEAAPWRHRTKWTRWLLLGLPAVAIATTAIIAGPKIMQGTASPTISAESQAGDNPTPFDGKSLPPNPYNTGSAAVENSDAAVTKDDVGSITSGIREPKITLREERIKLADAISRIGLQAGLTLDIAPGLPDFEITASYTDVPAREALNDMGKNFGFTVFDQGDRSVLIIPAVDHSAK